MSDRLLRYVELLSRPWSLLVLLGLAAGLVVTVNAVDLPVSLPAMAKITDAHILDMSFFYGADEVYRRFLLFGEAGRHLYLTMLWTFDIAIPLSYALALATGIHMAWRPWQQRHEWARYLFLLPLAAGLFDYGENLLITFLLLSYPTQHPAVANVAGLFTASKFVAVAGSLVLAASGVGGRLARRSGHRRTDSTGSGLYTRRPGWLKKGPEELSLGPSSRFYCSF